MFAIFDAAVRLFLPLVYHIRVKNVDSVFLTNKIDPAVYVFEKDSSRLRDLTHTTTYCFKVNYHMISEKRKKKNAEQRPGIITMRAMCKYLDGV